MKKCVFAGTFDPPTTGHERVIEVSLSLFDEVVVAIMKNTRKSPFLTEEERLSLIKKMFSDEPRVKVLIFDGAAVDLLKAENTPFYVRGVRNTVDFEYENSDFFASKKLMPELVEIYIPSEQENLHISSTLVKNSVRFNKDYSDYIPQKIRQEFLQLIKNKHIN